MKIVIILSVWVGKSSEAENSKTMYTLIPVAGIAGNTHPGGTQATLTHLSQHFSPGCTKMVFVRLSFVAMLSKVKVVCAIEATNQLQRLRNSFTAYFNQS